MPLIPPIYIHARHACSYATLANSAHLHIAVLLRRYGPGDQGAINVFYEAAIKPHRLPNTFNSKPYHPFDGLSKIVHFHGPKPHDFLRYLETGNCTFQDYCQTALMNGFCSYAVEWASFVKDEPVGQKMLSACQLLDMGSADLEPIGTTDSQRMPSVTLDEGIQDVLQTLGLEQLI